jgi:hypothetical protein
MWCRATIIWCPFHHPEAVGNVVDVGVAVGFLVTGIIRESRPGFGGLDSGSDAELDAVLGALSGLVAAKLGDESVLERMRSEVARTTDLRPRTRERVILALKDAVADDLRFAEELERAVAALRNLAGEGTTPRQVANEGGVTNTITGNVAGRIVQARDVAGNITF